MARISGGRRPLILAVAALLPALALSACTTTEGTNAFASFQTFEDEVLDSTATGLGLIPKQVKPDPTNARAPLALPKDTAVLPPPTDDTTAAALPPDSTSVKVDMTGLTEADLKVMRNARVVDFTTLGGRPLTEDEVRKLSVRMKAFRAKKERSIFLPPAQYYSTVKQPDNLVCLAANGDLVAVNDPACPPEIQKALLKKG